MTSRRGRKQQRYRRRRFMLVGIVAVLVGVFYLALYAPWFRIQSVDVSGAEAETTQQIYDLVREQLQASVLLGLVPGDARVAFDASVVEQRIQERFPTLTSIAVETNVRGVVHVTVERREPFGILCSVAPSDTTKLDNDPLLHEASESGDLPPSSETILPSYRDPFADSASAALEQCFFFDRTGVVYDNAPSARGSLIVTLLVQGEIDPIVGQRPLSDALMEWFLALIETLRQQSNIQVTRFLVPHLPAETVYVETAEGWWVALSASTDHVLQLRTLVATVEESLTPAERASLEYIDVRVPGRAYYK